jgi:hypothetical protein
MSLAWLNFDVRTGKVTNPPALRSEPIYELKVEGNSIPIKNGTSSKKWLSFHLSQQYGKCFFYINDEK